MTAEIKGNKLRGHLETMVLSSLEQGPGHGLAILQRLEAAGCGALRLKEGSLYPALYRMEKSKLISASWEENPGGRRGPARRVYRLTPKGKRHLTAGREEWRAFVNVVGTVLGVT